MYFFSFDSFKLAKNDFYYDLKKVSSKKVDKDVIKTSVFFYAVSIVDLKHSKIVNSKQGRNGGYYMLKDPKDVSVADVYRIFDGAISLLPCVSLNFYEKCDDCNDEATCSLKREFIKIREGARVVMSKTSFQSFLSNSK